MKRFLPANQISRYRNFSAQPALLSLFPHRFLHQQALFYLRIFLATLALLFSAVSLFAQQDTGQDAAYKKVIHDRVAKFVDPLSISDAANYNSVLEIISQRYYTINSLSEKSKANIAAIKSQNLSAEEKDALIKKEDDARMVVLKKGHDEFVAALQKKLSGEQVDKIKDGMTYSVLHVTYDAYVDMIPRLTTEQKDKIYTWLVEARELAMDGESSDKKHQIFGKYKGRINNYLAAQGYNVRDEEHAWQQRIKERKEMAKQSEKN
jgi:hypothetical protein